VPSTIREIKTLLDTVDHLNFADGECVAEGVLSSSGGQATHFRLLMGWNIALANRCDETWGAFTLRLLRFIRGQQYEPEQLSAVLGEVQVDDSHWRWLDKALLKHGDQYKWFFLIADGEPQAACLIFHPKPSAIDGAGIFYIEYIAAAPWNRRNPMSAQAFVGVGKLVVRAVSAYAIKHLGLRPGFSLHALPRAAGFYESLGMGRFHALDQGTMPYFEMPGGSAFFRGSTA
jgi:hypothetical protein